MAGRLQRKPTGLVRGLASGGWQFAGHNLQGNLPQSDSCPATNPRPRFPSSRHQPPAPSLATPGAPASSSMPCNACRKRRE
jgi:hypothetical protein